MSLDMRRMTENHQRHSRWRMCLVPRLTALLPHPHAFVIYLLSTVLTYLVNLTFMDLHDLSIFAIEFYPNLICFVLNFMLFNYIFEYPLRKQTIGFDFL